MIEVHRSDAWQLEDIIAKRLGGKPTEFGAFFYSSVCPWSVVTKFSRHLWQVYQACDGYRRCNGPLEFYALPGLYIEACDIFDNVRASIPPE